MIGKYTEEEIREKLYTGCICDVMDQMGYRNQAISRGIQPLERDTRIFGPAFTAIGTEVYSMPEDPLTAQCRIVDQMSEGEVFVLVIRGHKNCSIFGELFATAVMAKKGAGVLTDGYARDLKELYKMNFPLIYGGSNPLTSKGRCEINESNLPVIMDGVTINPGDYIFGDIDGVAVIPKDIAEEVIERCMDTVARENTVRERLLGGMSLVDAYKEEGTI